MASYKPVSLFLTYYPDSLVGKFYGYITYIPIIFVPVFFFIPIFHAYFAAQTSLHKETRALHWKLFKHNVYWLISFVINQVIVNVLKHSIKQLRPEQPWIPNLKPSFGMPSNHAQTMAFFCTWFALQIHQRVREKSFSLFFARFLSFLSLVLCALVCYSRVFLGYHTIEQVLVGAVLGFIVALISCNFISHKKVKLF
jgi:membrane-associated phospholipid phosphatase